MILDLRFLDLLNKISELQYMILDLRDMIY